MVFLLAVLVILTFVVLWNVDLHKILSVKSRSRNAGDAAALMAARWQGITLNLIGDLNLLHAAALGAQDADAAAAITNLQARLCFVGPMVALAASQQAAKNNGIYVNPDFTQRLHEHARRVREDYPAMTDSGGALLFPEPYPNAWEEYADMLETVAADGVAAGPDNTHLYGDAVGGHTLLTPGFYDAVAGRLWCWFYHNAPTLLDDYRNFFPCWWPPLPPIPHLEYVNSEIYGLGLRRSASPLADLTDWAPLAAVADARSVPAIASNAMTMAAVWYVYDTNVWSAWRAMAVTGPDPFPATGPLKPEYDYAGADAAVRVEALTDRLTPGPGHSRITNAITWTAAAKPFGYLNEHDPPHRYGLVLPAFHDARLIPVDASSAPAGGAYNIEWRRHIEEHLPDYMAHGPHESACWYCRQLLVWEDPAFRQSGVDWLAENSQRCDEQGGDGGGGHGGGRRRGH